MPQTNPASTHPIALIARRGKNRALDHFTVVLIARPVRTPTFATAVSLFVQ